MKKNNIIATAAFCVILTFLAFSCATMKNVLGEPSVSFNSVAIKGLDLEGITFTCTYTITNPYPIAISIKEVAADVTCDTKTFTKLNTDGGVNIASRGKRTNALDFKIPYTAIMNFAGAASGKTSLPFAVKGSVSFDLSSLVGLNLNDLVIPFSKDFDVPIIKPEFSVSETKVILPSVGELTKSFISGGVGAVKAAQLASQLLSGKKITSDDIFDGINLNVDIVCNLNVTNKGSSAWEFALKNCSLATTGGNIANLSVSSGNGSISGSGGTIPLKTTLNTLKTGAFIVQLLNKNGKNPVLQLESSLSFPNLSYAKNIPLSHSYEIPLSKVTAGN